MRVVAGELRGRRLRTPAGRGTRPTADRVREAVFSMLGPVEEARALDLYAGSGALGIEALSRGAESVVFVDSDPRAIAAIHRNLEDLGLADSGSGPDPSAAGPKTPPPPRAQVVRRDALAYMTRAEGPFDLVFVDPPYDCALSLAEPLSERLPRISSHHVRIVTESDKRRPLELSLPLDRERSYGGTRIAIHRGA